VKPSAYERSFIAPEFRSSEDLTHLKNTPKGDIWALGVLFFELLCLGNINTVENVFSFGLSTTVIDAASLADAIKHALSATTYQKKMIGILVQMVDPDPEKRIALSKVVYKFSKYARLLEGTASKSSASASSVKLIPVKSFFSKPKVSQTSPATPVSSNSSSSVTPSTPVSPSGSQHQPDKKSQMMRKVSIMNILPMRRNNASASSAAAAASSASSIASGETCKFKNLQEMEQETKLLYNTQVTRILKQGPLKKQSDLLHGWNEREYILAVQMATSTSSSADDLQQQAQQNNTKLFLYFETAKKLHGKIRISNTNDVVQQNEDAYSGQNFTFTIVTQKDNKKYIFAAKTAEERADWVKSINIGMEMKKFESAPVAEPAAATLASAFAIPTIVIPTSNGNSTKGALGSPDKSAGHAKSNSSGSVANVSNSLSPVGLSNQKLNSSFNNLAAVKAANAVSAKPYYERIPAELIVRMTIIQMCSV